VIVVQVAEEEMRDVGRADAEFQQPVMRAEAVVEHDAIAADFYQIAGAHPPQRRRRRSGS